MENKGHVIQVIGPVVDIRFTDGNLPSLYNAIKIKNKDKELDILWQELKTHKEERSPGVYLSVGFVVGALAMFLMTSIINFGVQSDNTADFNVWKKSSISAKKAALVNVLRLSF